jgi:hypothetical protein
MSENEIDGVSKDQLIAVLAGSSSEFSFLIKEVGGCSHAEGVCICHLYGLREEINRILKKFGYQFPKA